MSQFTIHFPSFLPIGHRELDLRSGSSGSFKADVLSGMTVALALVPEAVAFAHPDLERRWQAERIGYGAL